MPFNRREFLTGSSSLLVLGALGLTGSSAQAAALPATPAMPAQPAAPAMTGLERWLLETGRSSVDSDVYHLVASGVR